MKKTVVKIPKMDCASEERLVRLALDDLKDVSHLEFNLQDRVLSVFHKNDADQIIEKLKPLNFGSTIVSSTILDDSAEKKALLDKKKLSEDQKSESKVLWILLAINGSMFFGEITYGFIAQSTGLIADAMDMFADAAVYGVSLYAVGKPSILQKKAARFSGYTQLFLAFFVLVEVIRRFFYGSDPQVASMMIVSILALIANVVCLVLITRQRSEGAHMKASAIFSANDVIANSGVILAAILVYWTGSNIPDLIVGFIIAIVVTRGALSILKLSR